MPGREHCCGGCGAFFRQNKDRRRGHVYIAAHSVCIGCELTARNDVGLLYQAAERVRGTNTALDELGREALRASGGFRFFGQLGLGWCVILAHALKLRVWRPLGVFCGLGATWMLDRWRRSWRMPCAVWALAASVGAEPGIGLLRPIGAVGENSGAWPWPQKRCACALFIAARACGLCVRYA